MRFTSITSILTLPFLSLTMVGSFAIAVQANSPNFEFDQGELLLLTQNNEEADSGEMAPWSENWDNYQDISNNFTQGCVGDTSSLRLSQRLMKQDYCACALTAYQERYTPELFSVINSYAIEAGSYGPALVSLMMEPELKICSENSGFER